MAKTINESDVIEIIKHGQWRNENELINEIHTNAPNASRPQIMWKYDGKFYYRCSRCGYNASFKYNYCPNCGGERAVKK